MSCFVYILGSDGGRRTYVGWTTNLARRLNEHNGGTGARSTRGRHWRLLYAEAYPTRQTAMRREWYLKRDRRFRNEALDWSRGSDGAPDQTKNNAIRPTKASRTSAKEP